MKKIHSYFMQRCIEIAQCGLGHVAPNPLVGSVIVNNGEIISEGYHRAFGEAHAEVNAIRCSPENTNFAESTLYVNLEPCSHFGKTPPCADLIVSSGFKKVVIGTLDPNSLVAGKGIARLEEAGIEVISGVEQEKCEWLNRRFFAFHKEKRPYIILKWAESKDGFMDKKRDEGEKGIHWISSQASKRLVHIWRSEESSILIGGRTMVNDQPSLTVREVSGNNPLRVVLAGKHKIPHDSPLLDSSASTIFFHTTIEGGEYLDKQIHLNSDGQDSIGYALQELYQRNIQSVLVEGGKSVLESFIKRNLWDEARVIVGSTEFVDGLSAPQISGLLINSYTLEKDQIKTYLRK